MSRNKIKIIKGDKVKVIAGKNKNSLGIVKRVLPQVGKVVVEGINMVSKHMKPNPHKGIEGGIVKLEAPLSISNVAIYNEETGKTDKVAYIFSEEGNKVRVYRSNQLPIETK